MSAKGYIEIPVDEWTEVKERMMKMETMLQNLMDNHLNHCAEEIKWIKDRMSKGRPSWTVTTIIAFLSSLSIGLLVAYLNHLAVHGG